MIKISGDFAAKLDRWTQLLRSAEVIVESTSRAQSEVAITLIAEGFDKEEDPYGEKWAPKKVDDGRKVLHGETSALRTGYHVTDVGKQGFRIDPGVEYAAYHQEPRGGSRPQRMQVPSSSRGLPPEWVKEFISVALTEAAQHFREAGNPTGRSSRKRSRVTGAASGGSGASTARAARKAAPGKPNRSGMRLRSSSRR